MIKILYLPQPNMGPNSKPFKRFFAISFSAPGAKCMALILRLTVSPLRSRQPFPDLCPGPVVQRVKVEVHYPSGRYEVAYERVCRPGEKVRTHVTASGEATVQVLIDGELVAEYDLEPSP